jgi:hypothetical protein
MCESLKLEFEIFVLIKLHFVNKDPSTLTFSKQHLLKFDSNDFIQAKFESIIVDFIKETLFIFAPKRLEFTIKQLFNFKLLKSI